MLSRVAETVYWMSRYLERAENIARFIDVNWGLVLDMPVAEEQWTPLVKVTGDHADFASRYDVSSREIVLHYLIADLDYANSIVSCLRLARENARTVREMIPTEMWEMINAFYHDTERAVADTQRLSADPGNFCQMVKNHGLALGGVSLDTMAHNETWQFFSLGRLLERADKTSRILDVKYFTLLPSLTDVGSALDYIQWTALLKAASGLQAYRHSYGRITPGWVAEFMLQDRSFPRSVLFCLTKAQQRLHAITGSRIGHFTNPAERDLGLLVAELSYATTEEILQQGLHEFTDNLQLRINGVGTAVFTTFFATYPAIDAGSE